MQVLHVERRVAGGDQRVCECALAPDRVEGAIVHLDLSAVKVSGEQPRLMQVRPQRDALIDGAAGGMIDRHYRVGRIHFRVPAGDSAVFADEDELRRRTGAALGDLERAGRVHELPGRRRGISAAAGDAHEEGLLDAVGVVEG